MTRVPRSALSSSRRCSSGMRLQAQGAQLVAHEGHGTPQHLQRGAALRAASPMTEAHTVAWRRSGVTSTSVMVTKPTRGSCSSRRMMALISSAGGRSTRRVRSLTGYLVTARAMVSVVNDSMTSSSSNCVEARQRDAALVARP